MLQRYLRQAAALAIVGLLLCFAGAADAQTRRALVVGVDRYPALGERLQLKKAVSDAETMNGVLERLGFAVTLARNPTLDEMIDQLARLAEQSKPGDVVFVFFSGHGVAIDGNNLLLPSDVPPIADTRPGSRDRLRRRALAEADIVSRLKERMTQPSTGQVQGLVVLVIDACRDNPFAHEDGGRTRSLGLSRGLARPPASAGVFSIYSAGADQKALDRLADSDASPNSVFTRVFADYLGRPGMHLGDVVVEVREKVANLALSVTDSETGLPHLQTPAYYDETRGGRIYLASRTPSEPQQAPPAADPCAAAQADWSAAEAAATASAFEGHLARFGACSFAGLARARVAALRALQEPKSTAPVQRAQPSPILALASAAPPGVGPSFNCADRLGPLEHAICTDQTLSALDRLLADVYGRTFAGLDSDARTVMRDEQRAWLARRNACRGEADPRPCAGEAYRARIVALQGGPQDAAPVRTLTPETSARRPVASPSFRCDGNLTVVERAICTDEALAARDRLLSSLFQDARQLAGPMRSALIESQRDWVARRNACRQPDMVSCISAAYDRRIAELRRWVR